MFHHPDLKDFVKHQASTVIVRSLFKGSVSIPLTQKKGKSSNGDLNPQAKPRSRSYGSRLYGAHTQYRVQSIKQDDLQLLNTLRTSGGTPPQQFTASRERNSESLISMCDIYNRNQRADFGKRSGKCFMESAVDYSKRENFEYKVKLDGGSVTHLFLAHPESIALARLDPAVFVSDCTYKSNKYKLHLLHTVGVTPFNTPMSSRKPKVHIRPTWQKLGGFGGVLLEDAESMAELDSDSVQQLELRAPAMAAVDNIHIQKKSVTASSSVGFETSRPEGRSLNRY
ncbi:mutator-like element transposase [Drechslerella dactyloides]|uniref:Mutator-like element transposase n=1 Tax=Drechslerella dactyloides TaxID=74499 RepID=A0AAD6IP98_DREDA|nr:mutator-like element transposase [Drechslerella dactyloides]